MASHAFVKVIKLGQKENFVTEVPKSALLQNQSILTVNETTHDSEQNSQQTNKQSAEKVPPFLPRPVKLCRAGD